MAEPTPVLRDVPGPSALGGGWKRAWDLLFLIAVNDFKKTYFDTVLGYVWSLFRPLILFAVLLFVFTQIFRIGDDVPFYPVLLLFNIVIFGFFQEATLGAVGSVVGQEGIVRKTQFPRLVIPLATVLTALFNVAANMVVVLIFMVAYGVDPHWTWLLAPFAFVALLILTTAVCLLVSSLYVRYRDVGIIWGVLATALFYGSPVLYPVEIVPERFQNIILANPLSPIFIELRKWVIDPTAPGAVEAAGGWLGLLPAAVIAVGVCFLAVRIFNREAPRIAEEL
jgi:ABC-2 type transport system permease protein